MYNLPIFHIVGTHAHIDFTQHTLILLFLFRILLKLICSKHRKHFLFYLTAMTWIYCPFFPSSKSVASLYISQLPPKCSQHLTSCLIMHTMFRSPYIFFTAFEARCKQPPGTVSYFPKLTNSLDESCCAALWKFAFNFSNLQRDI